MIITYKASRSLHTAKAASLAARAVFRYLLLNYSPVVSKIRFFASAGTRPAASLLFLPLHAIAGLSLCWALVVRPGVLFVPVVMLALVVVWTNVSADRALELLIFGRGATNIRSRTHDGGGVRRIPLHCSKPPTACIAPADRIPIFEIFLPMRSRYIANGLPSGRSVALRVLVDG
jgi:hypothetical protein